MLNYVSVMVQVVSTNVKHDQYGSKRTVRHGKISILFEAQTSFELGFGLLIKKMRVQLIEWSKYFQGKCVHAV